MCAEVCLQVELAVEALATDLAGQLAVRCVGRAPFPRAARAGDLRFGRPLLLLVGDEAVAVEGDLRGEAQPALPALVRALVCPVLGDVLLEVGCAAGQVAALAAPEGGPALTLGSLGWWRGAVRLLATRVPVV